MLLAIPFPDISPEIFRDLHRRVPFRAAAGTAVAYIHRVARGLVDHRPRDARRRGSGPPTHHPCVPEQVEGLLTAVILGVIIGGRMGYALFYQPRGGYLSDPLSILWRIEVGRGHVVSLAVSWGAHPPPGPGGRVHLLPPQRDLPPLQVADAYAMVVAISGSGWAGSANFPSTAGGFGDDFIDYRPAVEGA